MEGHDLQAVIIIDVPVTFDTFFAEVIFSDGCLVQTKAIFLLPDIRTGIKFFIAVRNFNQVGVRSISVTGNHFFRLSNLGFDFGFTEFERRVSSAQMTVVSALVLRNRRHAGTNLIVKQLHACATTGDVAQVSV